MFGKGSCIEIYKITVLDEKLRTFSSSPLAHDHTLSAWMCEGILSHLSFFFATSFLFYVEKNMILAKLPSCVF